MELLSRLIIPARGPVYLALAPVTEPSVRVVAGGSVARCVDRAGAVTA